MTLSVGTGDYYNYNNNQVKVPYRPQEEQTTEEEIIIPYRRQDDTEPEEDTDKYVISTHGGAEGSISYDAVQSGSVSIKPYTYNVDIQHGDQTVTASVGPKVSVSGLGSQLTDNSDNPLDILPDSGAICLNAGIDASFKAKKDLASVDNTAVYGEIDAGAAYTHISPFKQKAGDNPTYSLNPSGDGISYNANVKVGIEYSRDDKNTVSFYANGGVQGCSAKMEQGYSEDAGTFDMDGNPQYVATRVDNNVLSLGTGVTYTRNTKRGQFSVDGNIGFGLRNSDSRYINPANSKITTNSKPGTFGSVTISYRF